MKRMLALAGLLALAAPASAQMAVPPPPGTVAKACQDAERRQFDFWIGTWDVYPTGKPKLVAHSRIESVYNGCGVRENWMPLNGNDGGSLSTFVPAEKGWRQTWIDSGGARVEFTGGWNGQAMVLTGLWPEVANGQDGLVRMTYTAGEDRSVRQLGEVSTDGGKTWGPSFDFTYRRAKVPSPGLRQPLNR